MASADDEMPLQGGHTTPSIVRVGDTVRRPPTINSALVQRLLSHLAAVGFDGSPRAFGTDSEGRDVLEYIEGEVPTDLAFHDDVTLTEAAVLIRRFHDASAGLVASPAARRLGLEVVCHNDLSPCNFIFRSGRPLAIIDFDAAAPGTRSYDLGYAVWLWLDLGSPDVEAIEQRRRLELFLKAYGTPSPSAKVVIEAALVRQHILTVRGEQLGNGAMTHWAESCRRWTERNMAVLR